MFQTQRNRITKTELCMYVNFLTEGYNRLVGNLPSPSTSTILLHAFSLLCRIFSLEYLHTKKQRYSATAACLMLALNVVLDEHQITYSDMIVNSTKIMSSLRPKYLVVSLVCQKFLFSFIAACGNVVGN